MMVSATFNFGGQLSKFFFGGITELIRFHNFLGLCFCSVRGKWWNIFLERFVILKTA